MTHVAKCNVELLYKQTHTIHDGFVRVHTSKVVNCNVKDVVDSECIMGLVIGHLTLSGTQ